MLERPTITLGVDNPKAAVVAIDLHRGRLDMKVATMPASPEAAARVITANDRLFRWCRSAGIPMIVVEDCVDTMDGPALHDAGLACIGTAFCLVMNTEAIIGASALGPIAAKAAE